MFEIIFYQNSAESIVVDKKPFLTEIMKLTGTLRNSTSIINPTIMVDIDLNRNVVINDEVFVVSNGNRVIYSMEEALFIANYCYIPKFNRYYYITDIVSVRSDLWSISMSVDVLTSYLDRILEQSGIISRTSNQEHIIHNLLDNKVSYEYEKEVTNVIHDIENVFVDFSNSDNTSIHMQYIAHLIVQDFTDPSEDTTYDIIDGIIQKPTHANTPSTGYSCMAILSKDGVDDLASKFIHDEFLASSVISIRGYPLQLPIYGLPTKSFKTVTGGNYTTTYIISDSKTIYNIKENFDVNILFSYPENKTLFLNYKPYSYTSIYLPYYGWLELDLNKYVSSEIININLVVDFLTGYATYFITSPYEQVVLDSVSFKIGMDITISWGNLQANEIARSNAGTHYLNKSLTSSILGGIEGVAGVGAFAMGSTAIGVGLMGDGLQRIIGGNIDAGVNYATQLNSIRDKITNVSVGESYTNTYILPKFIIRRDKSKSNYDAIVSKYGGKTYKYLKLSELSGYTQIGEMHLENIPTATKDEIDAIYYLLMSGVILP